MKIEIDLKIILLGILFFFLKEIDIYALFIIFIFFHEMAHLVVGMICGFKPKIFKMNPLGVSIEFYAYHTRKSLKKIITYLAGPIFNFLISGIFLFVSMDESLKLKIIYTNILLGLFNLIPIMPLDGGKILKEILIKKVGNKNATVWMNYVTKIILIVITLLYSILILKLKNFAIFLLILYLWYLKYLEDQKMRIFLRAYEVMEKN